MPFSSGPLIFGAVFCPARCGPMIMWGLLRALGSWDALEAQTRRMEREVQMKRLGRMFWKKGTVFKLSLVCPASSVHIHMARRVSRLRYRAWSPSPQSTLCAQFTAVSSGGRSKWPELAHGHCVIVKQCMVNAAPRVGSHRTTIYQCKVHAQRC